MLILSGKGEYKIVLRDWEGYESGTCLDAGACVAIARETGLLEKGPKYYELKGTEMIFRVLFDIEELFKTGLYAHPDSGEVTEGADAVFRYAVTQKAKAEAVASIMRRAAVKVNELKNPLAG